MEIKILMQGPIYPNSFSIYERYKKNGFDVVVSTYFSTEKRLLDSFDEKDLVLSISPPNMGNYNRNGHRLTANMGLRNILRQNENCFVLKTRTDHFFKKIKKTISHFCESIKKYPVESDSQNYRMVIPNAGTTFTEIWGKNHVGDHWMFGHITDVIDYYTLDNVDLTKDFQVDERYSPEPEFCTVWKNNKKIMGTFEELLTKRFIIIDNQKLDYVIAKGCVLRKCETDWDEWNSTDTGVVTNKIWKKLIKKQKL